MTKKTRRPLSRKAFERELAKAVDGDPSADPEVRAFVDEMTKRLGVVVAVNHPRGVEVLRKRGGADR
ncbi:hypothetical protein [Rothia halotolerans]|uniref:hypothetical protein n=1 Tax=Rothia halotolerans TaxID=405770 RepID=UPI00101B836F|nr:hypothetical protein [Rothia halotolerans]